MKDKPNGGVGATSRQAGSVIVMQNDATETIRLLLESDDAAYRLLPGESVELKLAANEDSIRICFYDGGLHFVGECERKQCGNS